MSRVVPYLVRCVALGVVIAAVGCNEPAPEPIAQDQTAELERQSAMQGLEDRLAALEGDLASAQSEADRLRNDNAHLRSQLAAASAAPAPAPPPAAGWKVIPGGAMTAIEGQVLFDSGKAKLKSSATTVLAEVARVIQEKYPGHDIYIFGHTDNQPIRYSTWKDNYELSCQRALSVLRQLREDGIAQTMSACGWGQDRPVADNSTPQSRQANRRVEIYAMEPHDAIATRTRIP